jgi:hypothetical protein
MKKSKLIVLAMVLAGTAFHGGGCGSFNTFFRFLGDLVATNIVLTNVD